MKEFEPFRLDTVNQCLWRGDGVAGERILLAPKAFDVLRYLVAHGPSAARRQRTHHSSTT